MNYIVIDLNNGVPNFAVSLDDGFPVIFDDLKEARAEAEQMQDATVIPLVDVIGLLSRAAAALKSLRDGSGFDAAGYLELEDEINKVTS